MTSAAAGNADEKPHGKGSYSAKDLQHLEGLEAVRKRPGMYIGSTDSKGLTHLAYEIIDNSVDEALAGFCNRVEVVLHEDGSIEVHDDGRGIPVDVNPKTGLTGVELVLTKLHAGGKFGGEGYKTSGGLHGVGASVVNALSARLDVTVRRGGRIHTMSFQRGVPGVFAGDGPKDAFTARPGVSVAGKCPAKQTGTSIRWWADTPLFSKGSVADVTAIRDRLRQTAFLVPGLTLVVRGAGHEEETFRFDGGVKDFVDHLAPDGAVSDTIQIVGSGNYKETVPVLDDKGHMSTQTVERHCEVDIALRWGTGYDTTVQSFCNVVRTGHGGSHQKGFDRSLTKTINEALRSTRVLKAKDDDVVTDDVMEGLTAVITVKVPEPQYLGQTKDELGTPGVSRIVADVVAKGIKAELLDNRKRKGQAKVVLDKVRAAAQTRQAAKASKDAARRKTALESSTLPAKLADCRSTDVSKTELWLVEGDSALGTGKLARNSEYQALLPLRGKILNVQKAGVGEMLANAECASIIQVVGAGSGRTFDLEQMRYNKICLMSVHPDDSVLLTDAHGRVSLQPIGPYVDERLALDDHVPEAGTVSYDEHNLRLRASSLKRVIRHHYVGDMLTLRTQYGRSVRVTSGHSVFAWRDGKSVLVPSDQLTVGDKLLAPRRLPRPAATLELDLLQLARQVDPGNYRVYGQGVARMKQDLRRAAGPTDSVDRSSLRVRLGDATRRLLVEARYEQGLTQKDIAAAVGWAQPISVSQAERGQGRVSEPMFRRWLDVLGLDWPHDAILEPSFYGRHENESDSANDRYRTLGAHAWISDVPSSYDAILGRDLEIYVRAHLDGAFTRFRAVDEDLCEFLGWYLAEGSLSRGAVRLHLGVSDLPYEPRLTRIIEELFGAKVTRSFGPGLSMTLRFSSAEATLLVRGLGLDVNAREKRVPDLLLNVDESCQLAFLAGYYLGDGSKGERDRALVFVTASRACADSLGYLLAQLGILAGVSENQACSAEMSDGRWIVGGPSWSIRISGRDQLRRIRRVWRDAVNADVVRAYLATGRTGGVRAEAVSEDLWALEITRIDTEPWDGDVYDFSVADDESFVAGFAGGFAAHNTDADVDGSHIRCLLITLFARYMRPVIEAGRLYAAVPPLHRIEVVGASEPIYTYTDKQLQQTLKKLESQGKRVKGQIQRYKGLGEMDPSQLRETTMHPATRTLRRITLGEIEMAEHSLELLMGNEVAPRREFIINSAGRIDRAYLDA